MRRPTRQAALGAAALLSLAIAAAFAGSAAVAATAERSTAVGSVDATTSRDRGLGGSTTGEYRVRTLRDDDVPVTAEQLRSAFPGYDEGWVQEWLIAAHCMAEKGYHLDPRVTADPPGYSGSAAERAELGSADAGTAYRWQDAGCWGYAVHVTGNDRNN